MGTVSVFGSPDSPNADKLMHTQLDSLVGCTLMAWDVPEGRTLPPTTLQDAAVHI